MKKKKIRLWLIFFLKFKNDEKMNRNSDHSFLLDSDGVNIFETSVNGWESSDCGCDCVFEVVVFVLLFACPKVFGTWMKLKFTIGVCPLVFPLLLVFVLFVFPVGTAPLLLPLWKIFFNF